MVVDEEGATGVRRGGLFTSDDFLICEGLSGGGAAAAGEGTAGVRSGGFAVPTSGAFRTCEGLSGGGAAAAGEGTAGVRSGGFAVPTSGAFRTCEGLPGGGGGVGESMILTPRALLLSS
jgi:hypothetical protein